MRTQITSEKCGECHGPYALGVKMGNIIFTTQIGTDVTGEMVAGGMKEQTKATMENAKAVLENGGVLGIFPAGEVATYYGKKYPHDKTWEQTIMKLVLGSNVPVVPVYFDGTNSKWFHFVGRIHPMLRTVNLIHEFNKRENSTITLKIGKPIGISELSKFKDIKSLSSYLRSRTYALEANVQRNIEQKILKA